MRNGNEVKIAVVIGIIMVTICLITYVTVKSKQDLDNVNIEVYKLYEIAKEDGKVDYEYHGCGELKTDDIITIMNEVDKAYKLPDENLLVSKQIEGYYKVIYNHKTVAFDAPIANENIIYREDKGRLYSFESNLYELVQKICETK